MFSEDGGLKSGGDSTRKIEYVVCLSGFITGNKTRKMKLKIEETCKKVSDWKKISKQKKMAKK